MSTLKLEENNFPFHSLHCKPSLVNILCGQISVSEWRHSKAKLRPDETTLWTGGRNSWAALILCVIWPAVHQMVSSSAFSQLNPPVYIWICGNRIDLCVVEHPSGSGFVFIPGPTWHWRTRAGSQWVGFGLHFYLKSQNILRAQSLTILLLLPITYIFLHSWCFLLLVFQNLEQNLFVSFMQAEEARFKIHSSHS